METKADVLRNPDSFLQIGDMVGASFFFASLALLIIALFNLLQLRSVDGRYKVAYILATLVPLVAAINGFYRRNYWITTMTNPTEFRFFDWVLTVPLMVLAFYFLLRPLGAKRGMAIRLFIASFVMLGFGYFGEALQPENAVLWGLLGTVGFSAIIAMIMVEGYPRIFRADTDPYLRKGYHFLSILLPVGWTVYPIGYMAVPGNILEGFLTIDQTAIMYNIADVINKGGLALGVYFIAKNAGPARMKPIEAEPQKAQNNNIKYNSEVDKLLKTINTPQKSS